MHQLDYTALDRQEIGPPTNKNISCVTNANATIASAGLLYLQVMCVLVFEPMEMTFKASGQYTVARQSSLISFIHSSKEEESEWTVLDSCL